MHKKESLYEKESKRKRDFLKRYMRLGKHARQKAWERERCKHESGKACKRKWESLRN